MHDVCDVGHVITTAVSVSDKSPSVRLESARLEGSVNGHDEVGETKVAASLDVVWNGRKSHNSLFTANHVRLHRKCVLGLRVALRVAPSLANDQLAPMRPTLIVVLVDSVARAGVVHVAPELQRYLAVRLPF